MPVVDDLMHLSEAKELEVIDVSAREALSERLPVTKRDQLGFAVRLAIMTSLVIFGVVFAMQSTPYIAAIGIVLLAAMMMHAVELQHQCLHHSAFMKPGLHRLIGIPLGIPMAVSYSNYRVRHLAHHRLLGTPDDTEFFGFDKRKPLTLKAFLVSAFDYMRIVKVIPDIFKSFRGTWQSDLDIGEKATKRIQFEYRIQGMFFAVLLIAIAFGFATEVMRLWLLPLLIAVPLHFLIELPEHFGCDPDTTDVLKNTRSITGSKFSTWLTNGNNLHIEHHSSMTVPLQQLRSRHEMTKRVAIHVENNYLSFFRKLIAR